MRGRTTIIDEKLGYVDRMSCLMNPCMNSNAQLYRLKTNHTIPDTGLMYWGAFAWYRPSDQGRFQKHAKTQFGETFWK